MEQHATNQDALVPLSVIIVTYNCASMVDDCLSSLADRRGVPRPRVIVVDNDSNDGTVTVVREHHPWVELVENSDNVGFGRACNQGLARVGPGDVLMLNPDTRVPPEGLARCLDELHRRPEVGVLGCRLVQSDGTIDHACRREIPTPGSSLVYLLRLDRLPGNWFRSTYVGEPRYDEEAVVGAVNGAFMLLRGEALAQVGGFDERFWMYGEDLDWCVRFTAAGWQVLYWPGVTVVHIKGGTSGTWRSLRVNAAFHHAMWLFYRKHQAQEYGPLTTAAVAAGIGAKFALSAAVSAVRRATARRTTARRRPAPVGSARA